MAKKKFSKNWIHQHINDPYVKLAQQQGYRARAAYKLIEILDTEKLMRQGDIIVDLGAAPGSWSQVARERLLSSSGELDGRVIALDLLPMEEIAGVEFFQGGFREDEVLHELEERLGGQKVDLVISDMAPNLSGNSTTDGARVEHLIELAVDFATQHLRPEGALVAKVFHGPGYDDLVKLFRSHFKLVKPLKPKSSRDKSSETFLVGIGLK